MPSLLLINPWIDDFAAFDLWARPLGLLYLASLLRRDGWQINLVDCLDRHYPGMDQEPGLKKETEQGSGTGKFYRRKIAKPACLSDIPRYYYRYGLTERLFLEAIDRAPKPAAILVTSGMTYWYSGVFEVIRLCKQRWPGVPVVLGGIYATLCYEHARNRSGADFVIPGAGEDRIFPVLEKITGVKRSVAPPVSLDDLPYPAFDLQSRIDYVCLLTSRGCPFHCAYCASPLLRPRFSRRKPENVVEEIRFWHDTYDVKDFAFYDDALLVDPEQHIVPILEGVLRAGVEASFHTPNGLHARFIDARLASLTFRAGFRVVRLGLETVSDERLDSKTDVEEFTRAVRYLHEAGFRSDRIMAYLLMGLPHQEPAQVAEGINLVRKAGATPYLAEYSPIPGTPLWREAVSCSRYDLAAEPLTHNNSALPCLSDKFTREDVTRLKQLSRRLED